MSIALSVQPVGGEGGQASGCFQRLGMAAVICRSGAGAELVHRGVPHLYGYFCWLGSHWLESPSQGAAIEKPQEQVQGLMRCITSLWIRLPLTACAIRWPPPSPLVALHLQEAAAAGSSGQAGDCCTPEVSWSFLMVALPHSLYLAGTSWPISQCVPAQAWMLPARLHRLQRLLRSHQRPKPRRLRRERWQLPAGVHVLGELLPPQSGQQS